MQIFRILALCAISLALCSSCAYHFQGGKNTLKELGIQKIYVKNFRNLTFRPGIEQIFTSAMVREIGRARAFDLVNREEEADAVLSGEVVSADSGVSATTAFENLPQGSGKSRSVDIANQYNSSVTCRVLLQDRRGRTIFSQSVSDARVHPGAVAKGEAGSTAALINESEQRLAYQFLSSQMMSSVYQSMVDTF